MRASSRCRVHPVLVVEGLDLIQPPRDGVFVVPIKEEEIVCGHRETIVPVEMSVLLFFLCISYQLYLLPRGPVFLSFDRVPGAFDQGEFLRLVLEGGNSMRIKRTIAASSRSASTPKTTMYPRTGPPAGSSPGRAERRPAGCLPAGRRHLPFPTRR